MIIIKDKEIHIHVPVYQRDKLDSCNLYRLMFYNTYTKDIYVFKVKNMFGGLNEALLRLEFEILLPDEFEYGTYNYYLVTNDDWVLPENMNPNAPYDSRWMTDKEAVVTNDQYIIFGNTMLLTGFKKARFFECGDPVKDTMGYLVGAFRSEDESAEGEIVKKVTILSTGLMQYTESDKFCSKSPVEFKDEKVYKQYKG